MIRITMQRTLQVETTVNRNQENLEETTSASPSTLQPVGEPWVVEYTNEQYDGYYYDKRFFVVTKNGGSWVGFFNTDNIISIEIDGAPVSEESVAEPMAEESVEEEPVENFEPFEEIVEEPIETVEEE